MSELRTSVAEVIDYPAILDEAWQAHLAPRTPDAPTVISLFAGGGGSSLGYSMAGYRELLAVEWDENAVATFTLNFPEVPVYHGDIATLSVEECLRLSGLRPGELDILDGSPPCQGFSMAGNRNLDDSRNGLFREYVRLLRGLRPRAFVMENVSGLVKGKMKLIFAEIMQELKASRYRVSARLINAMYFNVPQSRQRLIFIGIRDDLGMMPSHPTAQTRPVTIREAVPWIDRIDWDSQGIEGTRSFRPADEPCKTVRLPGGGAQTRYAVTTITGRTGSQFRQCETSVNSPMNAIQRSDPEQTRYVIRHVKSGPHWVSADRPSMTVSSQLSRHAPTSHQGTELVEVADADGTVIETRRFRIEEVQRLCSFPDAFVLAGTYREQWARLGNSVPPLFMRAIAAHVRQTVLDDLASRITAEVGVTA